MIQPLAWARSRAGSLALFVAVLGIPGELLRAEPMPPGEPTPVELTVVGGPALNPNAEGRAAPVVVRIFELTAAKAFESADFQTLFERPDEVLKHDLVTQDEFVLRPGEIVQRDRSLPPQVHALGLAAAFRELEHAVWHLTVPVSPGRRNFLLIDLDRDTIRLATVDAGQS